MKMQWVAPPNWPSLPPGFEPPAGWVPDESWPDPPAGWQFWQPAADQAPAPNVAKAKGASATVALGGALAILGSFLPWITINALGLSESKSGISYTSDGIIVLLIGIAVAMTAVSRMAGWQLPPAIAYSPIIGGLIVGALAIGDGVRIQHKINKAHATTLAVNGSVGAGVWLSVIGAVVMVIGAIALIFASGGKLRIPEANFAKNSSPPVAQP